MSVDYCHLKMKPPRLELMHLTTLPLQNFHYLRHYHIDNSTMMRNLAMKRAFYHMSVLLAMEMNFVVVVASFDAEDVVAALFSSLKSLATFEPKSLSQCYNRGKSLTLLKLIRMLMKMSLLSLETKVSLGDTEMLVVSPDTIPSLFAFAYLHFSLPQVDLESKIAVMSFD